MRVKISIEHEVEEKTLSSVYADTILKLMSESPLVVELEADLARSLLGDTAINTMKSKYPKQFIDCGIQEANMLGVAAGLSATGRIPYIHTFASFASRRIADQIFISGCYAHSNIRIVASDPGICAAFNGGTHMPFEDISILRAYPGMVILDITDSVMLKNIVMQLSEQYGMFYIRLFRKNAVRIYEEDSTFTIGKANTICDGKDVTIIAEGALMVPEALKAVKILNAEGISSRLIDMFTIKPLDEEAVIRAAKETGAIVTVENHNVINGLGSAVADVLVKYHYAPLEKVGIEDEFGQVGPIDYLKKHYKLTAEDIVNAAKHAISRK